MKTRRLFYVICKAHLIIYIESIRIYGMIEREITEHLVSLFQQYPIVTVTGPRQSGKTTLCRQVFPDLTHVNLEQPDRREFAENDPRGFLAQLGTGAIIDEVQRVPSLLSYLQVLVDEDGRNGLFVLTGSEQFGLREAVSQSLAGRTALLRLLPFSLSELQKTGASGDIDEMLYSGFYPRIHDQGLDPHQALSDYFETYVERDVTRLGNVRELGTFRTFVRLCAGRIGQLLNLSSLGSDAGVTRPTVRDWLTVLEASYIAFQLNPYHANIRKRMVKSPKLYFYDVGLVSYLLGIQSADQIATHPLRGQLFENAVVVEALKHRFNRGRRDNLSFFRDSNQLECDLFYETGHGIGAIEIKSGATISSSYFRSLDRVAEIIPEVSAKAVVYGGTERQSRTNAEVTPFSGLSGVLERIELDQEVSAFVDKMRGPAPADADVRTLDIAYRDHIRKLIDAMEPNFKQISGALFGNSRQNSRAAIRTRGVQGNSILDPKSWDRTKSNYIVKGGFKLANEWPVEIDHEYRFDDYIGAGRVGFQVKLSLEWRLDAENLSRNVNVDEVELPDLSISIPYSELHSHDAELDRTVTNMTKALMSRIQALSSD